MTGTLLKWVPALIVMLAGVVFCFRMLKRGLGTLEKFRKRHLEHIHAQERQIQDDRKSISQSEHLRLAHTAIADLLRLEGGRTACSLRALGDSLLLDTPDGAWRIRLDMREQTLRRTRRTLGGGTRWRLSGVGCEEEFADLAELMRALTTYLRGEKRSASEAAFARRTGHGGRTASAGKRITSSTNP
ncbi:MAG: translation initiation factor IF-2 [Desulfovibrio sp.]|jgi:hypothetical protein|nr:translation initiation factor IF-2 [Desulfovibrio sp.]